MKRGEGFGWGSAEEGAREGHRGGAHGLAARGHSCLLCGEGNGGRRVHVVCSPKDHFLAVITAYFPSEAQWGDDGRTRRFQ